MGSTSLPNASIEAPVETLAKNTSLPNMTWSLSAEAARQCQKQCQSMSWGMRQCQEQCQKQWQEPSQGGGYGPSWGPPKPSGWYQWVCNSHGRTLFCSSDCRNCN